MCVFMLRAGSHYIIIIIKITMLLLLVLVLQNYPYSPRGDNNSPPNKADQVIEYIITDLSSSLEVMLIYKLKNTDSKLSTYRMKMCNINFQYCYSIM